MIPIDVEVRNLICIRCIWSLQFFLVLGPQMITHKEELACEFENHSWVSWPVLWQCHNCRCSEPHYWCSWKARWKLILVYDATPSSFICSIRISRKRVIEKTHTPAQAQTTIHELWWKENKLVSSKCLMISFGLRVYLVTNSEHASAVAKSTHGRGPYVKTCKFGYWRYNCFLKKKTRVRTYAHTKQKICILAIKEIH